MLQHMHVLNPSLCDSKITLSDIAINLCISSGPRNCACHLAAAKWLCATHSLKTPDLGNYAFLDHTQNDSSSCDCENQTLNCDWKGLIASRSLCTLSFSPGYCRFPPVKNTFFTSASCCSGGYLHTHTHTHTHNTVIRALHHFQFFSLDSNLTCNYCIL